MNLFYAVPNDIQPSGITIRDQEAVHIVKVLRFQPGDQLHVTDGVGNLYLCEIRDIQKTDVNLSILDKKSEIRSTPFTTLCIGNIKKRDRLEFAAEKATELGVDRLIIFRGDHSQKDKIRKDRIQSTVLSAMKQSVRFFLPDIIFEDSLKKVLEYHKEGDLLLMADETTDSILDNHRSEYPVFMIVGPEGGFSKNERELLKNYNAHRLSLGNKRLRTETAAIIMVDRFKNRQ
tara:strand:- start:32772 stop:33467 length:696 start_codon:yes stop_codon:yes gene_type:complete